MIRKSVRLLCLAVVLLPARVAWSEEAGLEASWPFCPVDLGIPPRPHVEELLEPGDVHVLADRVDLAEDGVSHLEGNVQITRDQQQVRADRVDYDQPTDNADLNGDVHYWDDEVYLHSDTAHLEFDHGTGTAVNAEYRLLDKRGRGVADEVYLDVGELTRGVNVDFSTCEPEAEGADFATNAWKISARELTLNHETERGYAKHVILKVKDVPVFYTPYLTFPLTKKRKSGFLFPGLGTTSNHGFELRVPYYLNLAPQMDATLTPRLLTDSGVMAMGEFRYLLERGAGEINAEYLPSDDEFDDQDRSLIGFTHDQTFGRSGALYLTYNRASDKRYLEDFGTQLATTSARYLERRADLSYRGSWWNLNGRVQDYQTMDETIPVSARPYQRLPQIRVNAYPWRGFNRINVQTRAEFAYLDRDDFSTVPDVHGARVDLYPALSYPMRTRSAFLTPRLGVQFTQYDLEESGPFKSSPSRLLPIASMDGGLFLEREFSLGGRDYLHTFEPRLFYLYVPDDDQEDLPVFDTSIFNLSYSALFRHDRFSGPDRVGDANQITFGFSSRLIEGPTGNDLAYLRLAESYYLADQDVVSLVFNDRGQLVPVGRSTDDPLGPIIAELGTRLLDDWNLRGEIHWEPNENRTEKLALRALYRPGDGRILNLAYRVRRAPPGDISRAPTDVEQTDISLRWPIGPQWAVVGRWNYAVPEGRSLELFGGIEYESCCFGLRAVARRFLNNLDGDFSTGVFIQVELKGLAGIGKQTEEFLAQRIPGYEADF